MALVPDLSELERGQPEQALCGGGVGACLCAALSEMPKIVVSHEPCHHSPLPYALCHLIQPFTAACMTGPMTGEAQLASHNQDSSAERIVELFLLYPGPGVSSYLDVECCPFWWVTQVMPCISVIQTCSFQGGMGQVRQHAAASCQVPAMSSARAGVRPLV